MAARDARRTTGWSPTGSTICCTTMSTRDPADMVKTAIDRASASIA